MFFKIETRRKFEPRLAPQFRQIWQLVGQATICLIFSRRPNDEGVSKYKVKSLQLKNSCGSFSRIIAIAEAVMAEYAADELPSFSKRLS